MGKFVEYLWQNESFLHFAFDHSKVVEAVQEFVLQTGQINGLLHGLQPLEQEELLVQLLLDEALKTSEIEGEFYSRLDIMSSLRQQLGLVNELPKAKNKNARAIAKMMVQVRLDYRKKLTEKLLKSWHQILMAEDKSVRAGQWRKGEEAMQIISGNIGAIEVHYEAPPSSMVPQLMKDFVSWYHGFSVPQLGKVGEGMLKSAMAHLYFETIHPFEDGNGRIGRALAEKTLAENLELPLYISISSIIEKDKKRYYDELKKAHATSDITKWIVYFVNVLLEAEKSVKKTANFSIQKAKFFDCYRHQLNARQMKVIQKMMGFGVSGFEGGMNARKYGSIAQTSKATATRDLQALVTIGAFVSEGGGRSVRYELNLD